MVASTEESATFSKRDFPMTIEPTSIAAAYVSAGIKKKGVKRKPVIKEIKIIVVAIGGAKYR
jgi:hypothetical protein